MQPVCTSDNGAIVTIGIKGPVNATAIVIPVATDVQPADPNNNLCYKAVQAVKAALLADPLLLACISVDAHARYMQAVGMDNGYIPYREVFDAASFPGTGAATNLSLPSSIGGLVTFYGEPLDLIGMRMRHSGMTVPFPGETDIEDGLFNQTYTNKLLVLANKMISGMSEGNPGDSPFYRVLAAPPAATQGGTPGATLIRIATAQARSYPGTQRRRNTPWNE